MKSFVRNLTERPPAQGAPFLPKGGFYPDLIGGWSVRKLLLLAVALILFCGPVSAQKEDADVVRIDTDLATFDVNVTDSDGKTVRGLEAKDFKIFEDGEERPVEFF